MNAIKFLGNLKGVELYLSKTLPFTTEDGEVIHWVKGPTDFRYFVSQEYFDRIKEKTEEPKEVFDLWNL